MQVRCHYYSVSLLLCAAFERTHLAANVCLIILEHFVSRKFLISTKNKKSIKLLERRQGVVSALVLGRTRSATKKTFIERLAQTPAGALLTASWCLETGTHKRLIFCSPLPGKILL
jgi:hypothetical protein